MQSLHKDWWWLLHQGKPQNDGHRKLKHSTLSLCLSVDFSYLDWEANSESSSSTKPHPPQQSCGQLICLSRWPSLWALQGQSRGMLLVLLKECWLPHHRLSSSNCFWEIDRKIWNSFSFPANCSHLLPQFWVDFPFPLSSASTARLSPPHPSPPSPRTSKVITIMN